VRRLDDKLEAAADLDDCHLADDGAEEVAKILKSKTCVTELLVSDNNITEEGAAALAEIVPNLRRFDIAFNMLSDGGVDTMIRAMKGAVNLLHLNLRDNEIELAGAKALAAGLLDGAAPQLRSLNLRQNSIMNEGCIELCRALEDHEHLTALDVRENSIRADGAAAIARLVGTSRSLKYLSMCRNAVSNEGAKNLAVTLKRNSSLVELWMQDSHIENAGAEDLAAAIGSNRTLRRFDLRGNIIEMPILRCIGQVCSKNRTRN